MKQVYKALTIAGSDSGGGAGIQADLKTFQELEVFGMSAITAVTAQNTLGVQGVYPLSVQAVEQQIESIGTDLGADAVKTGMLFNSEIIYAVAGKIKKFGWKNVVVDPVMIAKGGAPLLQNDAISALKKHLLPLAEVVTPNIPEAEALTGIKIETIEDRFESAKHIFELGARNVVIKGGHEIASEAVDVLYDGREFYYFKSKKIETKNTHGTGCTFAAAIAAELAKGNTVQNAVQTAKNFIAAAIENQLGIGQGHGPTNHWAYRQKLVSEKR
ncbi:bifunctional hydroxymethylpyrimidine kinase/phosphomethylpyrimidine kinase [Bacillus methanolicus]|uniref:bifunctional hydroxymethylpyrimidine kinase/phosphomethylpyrimidine kinase n=1 Tax=Bacillus methanolicus TaxID=1471 RepID=UPI00200FC9D2|nr:bifunctional hydroxymethylpyrimidine kinase/phosphomethylpyrimidine kinase [Bacillus methanolicus]UQD51148.1 bifunctional hydroxymethylpyrimidine kinase/phosphomethylpyrimidine kinase [Bacillus methanolicus]